MEDNDFRYGKIGEGLLIQQKRRRKKHRGKMRTLLVTSNFYFSLNVFKTLYGSYFG